MTLSEALKNYIDRECTVTTRNDEYDGVLTEVGEGYIKINDGFSECFINIISVESVTFDNE